ncbi:hypothetical protein YTPLAS73_09650 [Nitrosarchaeum sp.]|nr:hypothetical protein YTPLAS73_09650 [Nitrosarchaeum sp.]
MYTKRDTMTKDKIIHTRIDDQTHQKLLEKCNELGCSISDYFLSILDNSLDEVYEEKQPLHDLRLDYGTITDNQGAVIGYLQGFPRPQISYKNE